jgi:hypothetical protein
VKKLRALLHGTYMPKLDWSLVNSGVLVACLWVAGHGAANAIVFKAIVDPAFHVGGTVATGSDLAWSAEMFFELDGCGPGVFTTCTTMDLLSATGTLYNINDPNHDPVSTPTTLTYFGGPPDGSLIHSVLFDGSGGILGLNTDPIGFAIALADPSLLPPAGAASLWLQFFAPNPNLQFAAALAPPTQLGGYLIVNPCATVNLGEESSLLCPSTTDGAVRSDAAAVSFVPVPEPGSLLLIIAALTSSLVVRRRYQ